jgi:hypothetical protein
VRKKRQHAGGILPERAAGGQPVTIHFETAAAKLLDLDQAFVRRNGLEGRVFLQY